MKDKKKQLIHILSADNHLYFKTLHAFRVIFVDISQIATQYELFTFFCKNLFAVRINPDNKLVLDEYCRNVDSHFDDLGNVQNIISKISDFVIDMKKNKVEYDMAITNAFNVINNGEEDIEKFILMYAFFISGLLPYDLDIEQYSENDFMSFSSKIPIKRKIFLLNYIKFILDTTYSGELDDNGEVIVTAGFVIGFHELFNMAKDLNERMLIIINCVEHFKYALLNACNSLEADLEEINAFTQVKQIN